MPAAVDNLSRLRKTQMNTPTRSLLQGLLLACLSVSAQAASMDASNQEGISAGQSANGTQR